MSSLSSVILSAEARSSVIPIHGTDEPEDIWRKLKQQHRHLAHNLDTFIRDHNKKNLVTVNRGRESVTIENEIRVEFCMGNETAINYVFDHNTRFTFDKLIDLLAQQRFEQAGHLIKLLTHIAEHTLDNEQDVTDLGKGDYGSSSTEYLRATVTAVFTSKTAPPISILTLPNTNATRTLALKRQRDITEWISYASEEIGALKKEAQRPSSQIRYKAIRALLYFLATTKIVSSSCNMIVAGEPIGLWFQYLEGGLNLVSTTLTRGSRILKADRLVLHTPHVRSRLNCPKFHVAEKRTHGNNPSLGAIAMTISLPGIAWDAVLSRFAWRHFVKILIKRYPVLRNNYGVLDNSDWVILTAAAVSSLVFQWWPINKNCHGILKRQPAHAWQKALVGALIFFSSLATVFQFWGLAQKSQEDFQYDSLFWICASGKFFLALLGALGKLINVVLKEPELRRWSMCWNTPEVFKCSTASLSLHFACGALAGDMLLSGALTFDGTNHFISKNISTNPWFCALSLLIALTQVPINYQFAVIPAIRSLIADSLETPRLQRSVNSVLNLSQAGQESGSDSEDEEVGAVTNGMANGHGYADAATNGIANGNGYQRLV